MLLVRTALGERRLAVTARPAATGGAGVAGDGDGPGLVWLGGFKSDQTSGKAVALDAWAGRRGRACLRFDYSGHGASEGRFEDGTIGLWLDDALAAIRAASAGPQILVGSSMGAWIALLAARALAEAGEAERIAGLVLIAPAVDFTEALMWERFDPEIRAEIERTGRWIRPSPYANEGYPVTRALIEEGRRHLLLGGVVRAHGPVHILQGMRDADVPWEHAMRLVEHLAADPVSITLVKDGDHRLSREEDIARLLAAVANLT
ncbi:alpha/beta hydrolase [Lichenibacterium ramalinae]|uniref:Palmitoyl-protein thioesterase ABHD10, mitochondrial n=1 Tax=Lichenibacterium ramalinae TaxID=2316527 RepID=A0A4Q2R6U1_9HYPH|nr:alpha/beta hydrolase [Lichenibacterium ramalinae]RYB02326.1 alpha/beta hydrolase [Lichenibacterium ramalinae]